MTLATAVFSLFLAFLWDQKEGYQLTMAFLWDQERVLTLKKTGSNDLLVLSMRGRPLWTRFPWRAFPTEHWQDEGGVYRLGFFGPGRETLWSRSPTDFVLKTGESGRCALAR